MPLWLGRAGSGGKPFSPRAGRRAVRKRKVDGLRSGYLGIAGRTSRRNPDGCVALRCCKMHAIPYPHAMHASETPPHNLGRKAAAADSPPLNPVDDPILNALRERVGGGRASASRIARFLDVHAGVLLSWLAGR